MIRAYYNEIDPYAAQWLRNLIAAGHIAPGDVDERDIRLVQPDDLRSYRQCHFFAGIGVWSHALRLAGWPDERPIWSGSCPCQPFSVAGKGEGHEDERHLWPAWLGLISESQPVVVVGEQVADGDGYAWLDDVASDMEGVGYTVGAVCPASCGFGAPCERQRLYFVAESGGERVRAGAAEDDAAARGAQGKGDQWQRLRTDPRDGDSGALRLVEPGREGSQGRERSEYVEMHGAARSLRPASAAGIPSGLAVSNGGQSWDRGIQRGWQHGLEPQNGGVADRGQRPGAVNGFWGTADWLFCTDGKWRPVESGTFPLAASTAGRLGRIRAYGNAINAEAAAGFLRAYLDVRAA